MLLQRQVVLQESYYSLTLGSDDDHQLLAQKERQDM